MTIKSRIYQEGRTPLDATTVPLSTPIIINVDPSDRCNLTCKFCPTGNRPLMRATEGRNFGFLSFELFEKVINDLAEFDKPIEVLRLYKDGEPLLHPKFIDMVTLAKSSGYVKRVDTTTNGRMLNPEFNRKLIASGIDRINVSFYGMSDDQYEKFSSRLDTEKLIANVVDLCNNKGDCDIYVKINEDVVPAEDVARFKETFQNIASGIGLEHVMSCWPDFDNPVDANQEVGIYGQPIKEVQVCPYIFYSFSINSNGTVSPCFLDWKRDLLIGDVAKESVKAIWTGAKMNELRKLHLRKERKSHPFCGDCGQMTHGMPDDMDAHAEEILAKMNFVDTVHLEFDRDILRDL